MADHVHVESAKLSNEEASLLQQVIDNRMDDEAKLVYADWLDEHGERIHAAFLRDCVTSFQTMNPEDFPDFDDVPRSWANMIGAPMMKAIATHGFSELRDELLKVTKPALRFSFEPSSDSGLTRDASIPIGGTKIFGLPDLPPGTAWPRQRDCNALYDADSGIEPELPCSFVCQINVAELAGTQFGRGLPDQGLISVFSCSEIDSIGMTDTLVLFTPDVSNLARLEAPPELEEDEANAIFDAVGDLKMHEVLELPPPSDSGAFEVVRFPYSDERYDRFWSLLEEIDSDDRTGIGGFTRPTTGDNDLPDADHCKLICIDNTIEIRLHFCISEAELAAGNVQNVECCWIDFD